MGSVKKKLMAIAMATTMTLVPATVQARTSIDYGKMKITYYCPCEICSEGYGRKTATPNVYARSEHTIAVDPDVISLGRHVIIGGKEYVAEDVGGRVCGDHIDIFVDTHQETLDGGVKYKKVKVIK